MILLVVLAAAFVLGFGCALMLDWWDECHAETDDDDP